MDILDSVAFLADHEGYKLRPKDLANLETGIPFFHVEKGEVKVGGFQKHDNADRMVFLAKLFQGKLFGQMDAHAMMLLNGYYNVELHDTYAYLENNYDYRNCLVWSKRKCDQDVVLMPDLYHLVNYGGKLLNDMDTNTWEGKKPRIGFWGTTTGHRNPLLNERINMCRWGRSEREKWADFYITKVAQMSLPSVRACVPEFDDIYTDPVNSSSMFEYRYLLDIPGNTCSWDRVPLIMNSKSLLFKLPCKDMCFYYPLLHNGTHFVEVDKTNMVEKAIFYENNPNEAKFIIQNANKFSKDVLNSSVAEFYFKTLLEASAYRHGR